MSYQKSEETRIKIDDTAKKLFHEKGFKHVGMLDIAKASGVSRTALYYYYPNKNAIVDHMLDVSGDETDVLTKKLASNGLPLMQLIILPYYLTFRVIEKNLPFGESYFTGFDFENRSHESIERLKGKYSAPAIWKLFEEAGQPLTENEKTAIILAGNALWRSFFQATANGLWAYTSRDILDFVMKALILDRLQIPWEFYEEQVELVEIFIKENNL